MSFLCEAAGDAKGLAAKLDHQKRFTPRMDGAAYRWRYGGLGTPADYLNNKYRPAYVGATFGDRTPVDSIGAHQVRRRKLNHSVASPSEGKRIAAHVVPEK